jgi:hypothetical protein
MRSHIAIAPCVELVGRATRGTDVSRGGLDGTGRVDERSDAKVAREQRRAASDYGPTSPPASRSTDSGTGMPGRRSAAGRGWP